MRQIILILCSLFLLTLIPISIYKCSDGPDRYSCNGDLACIYDCNKSMLDVCEKCDLKKVIAGSYVTDNNLGLDIYSDGKTVIYRRQRDSVYEIYHNFRITTKNKGNFIEIKANKKDIFDGDYMYCDDLLIDNTRDISYKMIYKR